MWVVETKEALFYKKWSGEIVCQLCPQACVLLDGETGKCGVRKSTGEMLASLNYGKIIAQEIDPIEKKPLFHFWPGSRVLSIAAPGCNLHCKFCQNWQISQKYDFPEGTVSPEKIVETALKTKCRGIAYTYTEPTVFYEFALDVAKLAKKAGLYNVWVSNGMINQKPLKKIAKFLDAVNTDIKGNSQFYRKHTGGVGMEPVLNSIRDFHKAGVWVEVTNLIIPKLNDSDQEIKEIVEAVAAIDENIPFHISRFHSNYEMQGVPETPIKTLEKALKIAKERLRFVYIGNVPGNDYESTKCVGCGLKLIERNGYSINKVNLKSGACIGCGFPLKMIGKIIKPF